MGTGGTPVPLEWGEEARVKARQRQRRLLMLSQEDGPTTSAGKGTTAAGVGGRTPSRDRRRGAGAGVGRDARAMSRVPWELLDELDAEKQKLRVRINKDCCVLFVFFGVRFGLRGAGYHIANWTNRKKKSAMTIWWCLAIRAMICLRVTKDIEGT